MKQKRIAALAFALCLCLVLAACGRKAEMTDSAGGTNASMAPSTTGPSSDNVTPPMSSAELGGWEMDSAMGDPEYGTQDSFPQPDPGSFPQPDPGSDSPVYQNSDVKLIRRASLSVQTDEFDKAMEYLRTLVSQLGGYFQRSQTYGGGYYDRDARRSGYFTVRVPAEQYDTFVSHAGQIGYVIDRDESTENVGELYFDLEARLATQRTKQERLLDLLSRAENMEDIILLENALSEVEYQIEQYSSSLNRYDSLIGFATIELNLQEVVRIVEEPGQTDSLLQRMAAGVASSAGSLAQGFQDLLIWLSYNLFSVLFFAVLIVALVVVLKWKKPFARLRKKNPTDQT